MADMSHTYIDPAAVAQKLAKLKERVKKDAEKIAGGYLQKPCYQRIFNGLAGGLSEDRTEIRYSKKVISVCTEGEGGLANLRFTQRTNAAKEKFTAAALAYCAENELGTPKISFSQHYPRGASRRTRTGLYFWLGADLWMTLTFPAQKEARTPLPRPAN